MQDTAEEVRTESLAIFCYGSLSMDEQVLDNHLEFIALLRSLSGKYPWERYESNYSPSSYG